MPEQLRQTTSASGSSCLCAFFAHHLSTASGHSVVSSPGSDTITNASYIAASSTRISSMAVADRLACVLVVGRYLVEMEGFVPGGQRIHRTAGGEPHAEDKWISSPNGFIVRVTPGGPFRSRHSNKNERGIY